MSTVGTDTPTLHAASADGDPLLAGLRRLMRLADGAAEPETVMRALAGELFELLGAAEVHVHHLAIAPGASPQAATRRSAAVDPVVVYMFGGDGRLSYDVPSAERPPGVAWVASTGQSVLVDGARELIGAVPRVAATGEATGALLLPLTVRGEIEAVVVVVRRGAARARRARDAAGRGPRRPGRRRARAAARARRSRDRRGDGLHEPPRDAPSPARRDRPRGARPRDASPACCSTSTTSSSSTIATGTPPGMRCCAGSHVR